MTHYIIVGGGTFGLSTAMALLAHTSASCITILDKSSVPAKDAASTDINKIVRPDYGSDILYSRMALDAIEEFKEWNKHTEVYRETGVLFAASESALVDNLSTDPPVSLSFEKKSIDLLKSLGQDSHLQTHEIKQSHALSTLQSIYPGGYFNKNAGWANSELTIKFMAEQLSAKGVVFKAGKMGAVKKILDDGLITEDGYIHKGRVVVATGAWTAYLIPEMQHLIKAVGKPVVHFKVHKTSNMSPNCVWAADISNTGYYGFPATDDGEMKIGNHAFGYSHSINRISTPRTILSSPIGSQIPLESLVSIRSFLAVHFPDLNDVDVYRTRMCWYTDSFDGDFFICPLPSNKNVVVATGGSGHGFKFAPVIGRVVVDVLFGVENECTRRFRWREPDGSASKEEIRPVGLGIKELAGIRLASARHLKASSFVDGFLVEPKM